MNRSDRLTAILLLLQDRPRTSLEIAEHFEISKRTVLRDIQALYEAGAPIVAQEGSRGGYSLPADARLAPLQLTLPEALLLLFALNTVEKLSDIPYAVERVCLLAKLRLLVPARHRLDAEHLLAHLSFDIPERSQRAPFAEKLLECARNGQWIKATYRSARGVGTPLLLPKKLICRNGLWYCEAYAPELREERTYRVDRFLEIAPTAPPNEMPAPVTALPYNHASHPEVIVHLTGRGVLEAERETHLGSAVQRREDGSGLWQFRCPPAEFDWLTRYLLSLGTEAEVQAPEELRSRLRQAAAEIFQRYPER